MMNSQVMTSPLPLMVPYHTGKKWWAKRQARKRTTMKPVVPNSSKREGYSEDIKFNEKIFHGAKRTKNQHHHVEDASAAATGLWMTSNNNVEAIRSLPIPGKLRNDGTRPPALQKADCKRFPGVISTAQNNGPVDIRFIDNPIGIGSYKDFDGSPKSSTFSASTGDTLVNDGDNKGNLPFDAYKDSDRGKAKRKGRAKSSGGVKGVAAEGDAKRVKTQSPASLKWRSRGKALSSVLRKPFRT